eukprot:m.87979 g.87979  ORF g.87979 m.87979 type:complete len:938 (+) comp14923_c0_seq4:181-2994(+)
MLSREHSVKRESPSPPNPAGSMAAKPAEPGGGTPPHTQALRRRSSGSRNVGRRASSGSTGSLVSSSAPGSSSAIGHTPMRISRQGSEGTQTTPMAAVALPAPAALSSSSPSSYAVWQNLRDVGALTTALRTLDAGFDPADTTLPTGETPLHRAAETGNVAVVQALLDSGFSLLPLYNGWTPLHAAASAQQGAVLSALLQRTRAPEFVNHCAAEPNGRAALHLAAITGNNIVVSTLISAGALLDLPDAHGDTPLMLALEHRQMTTAALLVKQPSSGVNTANKSGMTPLIVASRAGLHDAVAALLIAGADPEATDKAEHTALWHAKELGNERVAHLLHEAMRQGSPVREAMVTRRTRKPSDFISSLVGDGSGGLGGRGSGSMGGSGRGKGTTTGSLFEERMPSIGAESYDGDEGDNFTTLLSASTRLSRTGSATASNNGDADTRSISSSGSSAATRATARQPNGMATAAGAAGAGAGVGGTRARAGGSGIGSRGRAVNKPNSRGPSGSNSDVVSANDAATAGLRTHRTTSFRRRQQLLRHDQQRDNLESKALERVRQLAVKVASKTPPRQVKDYGDRDGSLSPGTSPRFGRGNRPSTPRMSRNRSPRSPAMSRRGSTARVWTWADVPQLHEQYKQSAEQVRMLQELTATHIKQLQENSDRIESLEREVVEHQDMRAFAEAEAESLAQKSSALHRSASTTRTELERRLKAEKTQRQEAQAEVDALKTQLAHVVDEKASVERVNGDVLQDLSAARAEIKALRQAKLDDVSGLDALQSELERQKALMKQQAQQLEQHQSMLVQAEAQASQAKQEADELRNSLARCKADAARSTAASAAQLDAAISEAVSAASAEHAAALRQRDSELMTLRRRLRLLESKGASTTSVGTERRLSSTKMASLAKIAASSEPEVPVNTRRSSQGSVSSASTTSTMRSVAKQQTLL